MIQQGRPVHEQWAQSILLSTANLLRPRRVAYSFCVLSSFPVNLDSGRDQCRPYAPSHISHEHRVRLVRSDHGVRRFL